ncbi:hypothetical protein R4I43_09835 [Saccharopolyspora sp. S2-29]|uniref:Rhamnogalacturonan I lyase beta-sheet domain-containing protein n=1 Tax=Saccharopolyspora mangrovi TaxID=3082379 RepID=A0ABU6A8K5_9PSEU|nr:hypothetical protein [Saccharopolyspora sp. S2-29]
MLPVLAAALLPVTWAGPVSAAPVAPDRAAVAISEDGGNFVSWRRFGTDPAGTGFDVYRDGTRITTSRGTNFFDAGAPPQARYSVVPAGTAARGAAPARTFADHLDIPLQVPEGGTTPSGEAFTYSANDVSVGDLDGDGQYEYVVKWDPSNAKDNSQAGHTGNAIIDAYRADGTRLWRIDLGRNIRAGAHYTQFQVYDYDGDGKAEVAMKTADGTVDGAGNPIGDARADFRDENGYVLEGPEFLTVFDGTTGAALHTTDYIPQRGDPNSWGDSTGNRSDRFLAATAQIGGKPALIEARGYYTRTVITAWDFSGGRLTPLWTFDSDTAGEQYAGQGNHNLSVADVDGDGNDEVVYGRWHSTTPGNRCGTPVSDTETRCTSATSTPPGPARRSSRSTRTRRSRGRGWPTPRPVKSSGRRLLPATTAAAWPATSGRTTRARSTGRPPNRSCATARATRSAPDRSRSTSWCGGTATPVASCSTTPTSTSTPPTGSGGSRTSRAWRPTTAPRPTPRCRPT